MKKLQFVKIKCQCGHVNFVPVTEVFHVYENIKCETSTYTHSFINVDQDLFQRI